MAPEAANGTRTVVITGASTGIGEACALRFDKLGLRVFAGVRKEADGERLQQQTSDRLSPVFLDVTDEMSIGSAAETVGAAVGDAGLAGLVNNAGITVPGPLEFLPIEDLRLQIEVNLIGQIAVTQAFLPLLRQGKGRIVNMGSVGGRMATPFIGAYCASKFALEGATDSLRQELRPWGISVSIVEPGSIATPIWEKGVAAADKLDEKLPQRAHDLYDTAVAAMRRVVDKRTGAGIPPDEVAKAVAHALTAKRPKTRYLVGLDARLPAIFAKILPDRVRDGLVARAMGLPSKA
jgi:NAD(P)-dependent dehydrogenase (short-subunit alcohol dehydrogenase family)